MKRFLETFLCGTDTFKFIMTALCMAFCITACGGAQTQITEPAATDPVQEEAVEEKEPTEEKEPAENVSEDLPVSNDEIVPGEELLCLCDTEEDAEEIADMYGIELVKFSYGVATFHAENPKEVISLGQEKGYPALELNGVMHVFEK
jgi:hypothetical protein